MGEVKLGDTSYFFFPTHSLGGAITDADVLPTSVVYEDAAGAVGGGVTVVKVAATTGWYYVEVVASGANGFEAGKTYNVTVEATVGGTTAGGRVGRFAVRAASVDDLVRSTTPANALDVSATGEAGLDFNNIKQATAPTTLTDITIPRVTLTDLTSALTGYTVYGPVAIDAATATTIDLPAGADTAVDAYNDSFVFVNTGTAAGHMRRVSDYTGLLSRRLTLNPAWLATEIPAIGDNVSIIAFSRVDVGAMSGSETQATYLDQEISTIPGGGSSITGSVNDAAATRTSFISTLVGGTNNQYHNQILKVTSGTYSGLGFRIDSSVAATGVLTLFGTGTPTALANGVTFSFIADDPSGTPTISTGF